MSITCSERCAVLGVLTLALSGCGSAPVERAPSARPVAVSGDAARQHDLALSLMEAGHYVDAEAVLVGLTREAPALAGPHLNLGIVYANTGRLEDAEVALRDALAAKPDAPEAHNELGIVYRKLGRFEEAERAYAKALELDPDYAKAHFNLGVLYDIYLRRARDALEHYARYQSLSAGEDEQVSKWVADLRRRADDEQTAQVVEQ